MQTQRIRLFGPRGYMGIGIHLAQIMKSIGSFEHTEFAVQHFHDRVVSEVREAIATTSAQDVNIFFGDVDFGVALKGAKFYWAVFESSRPPPRFEDWLKRYDFVLSPSQWGIDCMVRAGLDDRRLLLAPEGVDPLFFHRHGRPTKSRERPFRFLMMGKYETRKGYEVAFDAFERIFARESEVELWVKPEWISESRVMMAPQCLALMNRYKHLPIKWIRGFLNAQQLLTLHHQTDAFLFPSFGEGWGLPLIEAIAAGTPVICTNFGGQSQYLNDLSAYVSLIQYEIKPITCEQWRSDRNHPNPELDCWAYPDVAHMADLMSELISMPSDRRFRNATLASDQVRRDFTWIRAADRLLSIIEDL